MKKKLYLIGNHKMNFTREEILPYLKSLDKIAKETNNLVGICVSDVNLAEASNSLKNVVYGSQNIYHAPKGAFTGETSVEMIKSYGAKICLVGHSERKHIFGETDADVNKKVIAILENGLTPIICVGETLSQRENNKTRSIVKKQLLSAVNGLSVEQVKACWFAYEPVWAIGTGKSSTAHDAEVVISYIQRQVLKLYPVLKNERIIVLYGGSLNEKNAHEILSQKSIGGGLIGGACLDIDKFKQIIDVEI